MGVVININHKKVSEKKNNIKELRFLIDKLNLPKTIINKIKKEQNGNG